jgi:opacity protein-like surface antigen
MLLAIIDYIFYIDTEEAMKNRVTRARRQRMPSPVYSAVLFALLGGSAVARATDEDTASMFSFSGFGTAGVVHSNEHDADFTSNAFQPNGAGYTHDWSPAVDSLIGAQVVANFSPRLSAMLQLISEQNYDNSYTPHVEWANVKYELTPDASIRVGRIVLVDFLFSDTHNVGYTLPWVRPPVEVYSLVPIDTNDGVDASYSWTLGRVTQRFVAYAGTTSTQQPAGGYADARRHWGVSDTLEYGAASLRVTYSRASITLDGLDTFVGEFGMFGPQGAALQSKYDPYRRPAEFEAIGAMYDPRDWFVAAEWGASQFHSLLGESTAWYVSGGYRLGKFTPYATYGALKGNSNTYEPGLNVADLPPNLAGPASALNKELTALLAIQAQNTLSAGLRWDLLKNVDLKLQYDHTRLGKGSAGLLKNEQPGFQVGGTLDILSVAIDFIW